MIFKRKYKYSLPYILEEISNKALQYNKLRNDNFDNGIRCITFAFDGSTLLGWGINKEKTHPKYKEYVDHQKLTTHAEIDLIIKLLKKYKTLKNVTDIVCIRGVANLLNSYPCKFCLPHLKEEFENARLWYYLNNKWQMELL